MKITSIRQKNADGTWSEVAIGAAAANINYDENNNLTNVIGDINVSQDGNIATQINNIKAKVSESTSFVKEISETDEAWSFVNNRWRYEVPYSEHQKSKISDISVQRLLADVDYYTDVDFGFKKYFSGKIAVILDTKITGKIIIEGD